MNPIKKIFCDFSRNFSKDSFGNFFRNIIRNYNKVPVRSGHFPTIHFSTNLQRTPVLYLHLFEKKMNFYRTFWWPHPVVRR